MNEEESKLPAAPESVSAPPSAAGAWNRLKRMILGLVILGLALATLYLLAERNSRSYYLSMEEGQLVVSKGAWLPAGKRPYLPADPHFAKVYAPVPVPEGTEAFVEQRFDERQDLDRVLFGLLADWAERLIQADDPVAMREGFLLVERAGLLSGIDAEQQGRLRALRAELAFFEGRAQLDEAVARLREAREKLELAAEASSPRGQDAARLLKQVAPAAEVLHQALRRAKGFDSSPMPESGAALREHLLEGAPTEGDSPPEGAVVGSAGDEEGEAAPSEGAPADAAR